MIRSWGFMRKRVSFIHFGYSMMGGYSLFVKGLVYTNSKKNTFSGMQILFYLPRLKDLSSLLQHFSMELLSVKEISTDC